MITRHYKRIVKDILQRGGAKYDAYAVTASDGRPYYTAQEQPNYSADQTAMSMSTDQPGVIIGSGTAAESETSYWLQQQITSGFTGSVMPIHEMVDGTHALCLYVTITNTGSSSITISEIGYALITPLMRRPSDSQFIGSPYPIEKNVLIDRTVLASPITIAAGNSVRLKYALKTTDEIFSGSVVLIQKTINVNGVYNASSDNADGYSEVTVSVTPNLQSKTATQNGTVTPDQGYDGLSSVVVNVSGGGGGETIGKTLLTPAYAAGYGIINRRIVTGFVHNYGFIAPADDSGWLDVNWKGAWEIGVAFKVDNTSGNFALFGNESSTYEYASVPSMELINNSLGYGISSQASSWSVFGFFQQNLSANTWYFVTMSYDQNTMTGACRLTTDFVNYEQVTYTMTNAPYHSSGRKIGFGGLTKGSGHTKADAYIDMYNCYIKYEGTMIWGAYSGGFID